MVEVLEYDKIYLIFTYLDAIYPEEMTQSSIKTVLSAIANVCWGSAGRISDRILLLCTGAKFVFLFTSVEPHS